MARFVSIVLIVLFGLASGVVAQTPQDRPILEGLNLSKTFEDGPPTEGYSSPGTQTIIKIMRKYDPETTEQFEKRLKQKTTPLDRVAYAFQLNLNKVMLWHSFIKMSSDALVDVDENEYLEPDLLSIDSSTRNYVAESIYVYFRDVVYKNHSRKIASFIIEKLIGILREWENDFVKNNNIVADPLKTDWLRVKRLVFDGDRIWGKQQQAAQDADKDFSVDDPLNRTEIAQEERIDQSETPEDRYFAVDDSLNRTQIIREDETEPTAKETARRQEDGAAQAPERQGPSKPLCDESGGEGGEWHSGTLAKVAQIASEWNRGVSSGYSDWRSYEAYMETLMIWKCHVTFVKFAMTSSKEERKRAREEACAIEKTLEKTADHLKATGFWKAGASWKPFHIDLREKWDLRDPCDASTIEEAGSGSAKDPQSTNSTDRDTGETAISVKNPDGTRTVTRTDRDGNVSSTETVGNSPTSASSTDEGTGITTTSVRNPDGSRTVTTTDKDGNVLSRETVGQSPDFASSTERETSITTTSVANPDGSRTVTRTDKDGNVLSREKVR